MTLLSEKEKPRSGDLYPIPELQPPPFVNELLAAISPTTISPRRFTAIVEESRLFEESAILVRMTRDVDISGLAANLVGTCQTPEEVFNRLRQLGKQQLDTLAQYADVVPTIPEEVYNALGGKGATLRAVLILDDLQERVVAQLKSEREQSPIAMAVRKANTNALTDLYRNTDRIRGFGMFLPVTEQLKLFSGEPRMCYMTSVDGNAVRFVQHYFLRPTIRSVRLGPEFAYQSVADILSAITPDYYNRAHEKNYQYDPRTPEGLIALLGKVGHPLPRFLAQYIKQDQTAHQRILREENATEAVKDMLRSH